MLYVCDVENFESVVKMDDEVDVNDEQHVDCSEAFNTSQVIIFIIVIKLIK